MRTRGSVGLRASISLICFPRLVAFRPTHSLRPFSIRTARYAPPKIQTRFSGPQPKSAPEAETLTSATQPAKKLNVLYQQPLRTDNPSALDERAISFAEVRPFPDQDLSSTRPAPLQTPEAPKPEDHGGVIPIAVRLSYFYRLGKSYLTFYKSGLKNVWFNNKEYQKIKKRLGPFSLNDVAKYSGKDGRPTISRREYQLCIRTRHDIRKLIPFGLIFLICGEFTPLVVLALGSAVVPSTCQIPKQVWNDYFNTAKRLKKLGDVSFVDEKPSALPLNTLEARVGYLWGLMPSPRPLPLIHYLLRRRVESHAEELVCDAILVRREGGLARLPREERNRFGLQASCVRFDRLVNGVYTRPIRLEAADLRRRFDSSYEEYLNSTLERLRKFEDSPRKHYVAGLNF